MLSGTALSYTRAVLDGEQPQLAAAVPVPAEDEDNDDGTVHGPRSLSDIELAHTLLYIVLPLLTYLQNVDILADFLRWLPASTTPNSPSSSVAFYTRSCIAPLSPIYRQPPSMRTRYSTVESMSITPPSPISMRPAISVVPAGCTSSKFGQIPIGMDMPVVTRS
jgi:hypothetical protein